MEPPKEEFADGQDFVFEEAKDKPHNKRHSLAALKDIVTGRRDWWEKKANKTGSASARGSKVVQSVVLPNMAAAASSGSMQGRPATGLLFSLPPQDPSSSPTPNQHPPTPTRAMAQSLPQFPPHELQLQAPQAQPPVPGSPSPLPAQSPASAEREPRGLRRMLSKLTRRSSKGFSVPPSPHSAVCSPAPSMCSPSARSPVAASLSKPRAFGSPTHSSGGGADDTRGPHPDQYHPPALPITSSTSIPRNPSVSLEQAYSANEEFSASTGAAAGAAAGGGSPQEVQSALKGQGQGRPREEGDEPGSVAFHLEPAVGLAEGPDSNAAAPALAPGGAGLAAAGFGAQEGGEVQPGWVAMEAEDGQQGAGQVHAAEGEEEEEARTVDPGCQVGEEEARTVDPGCQDGEEVRFVDAADEAGEEVGLTEPAEELMGEGEIHVDEGMVGLDSSRFRDSAQQQQLAGEEQPQQQEWQQQQLAGGEHAPGAAAYAPGQVELLHEPASPPRAAMQHVAAAPLQQEQEGQHVGMAASPMLMSPTPLAYLPTEHQLPEGPVGRSLAQDLDLEQEGAQAPVAAPAAAHAYTPVGAPGDLGPGVQGCGEGLVEGVAEGGMAVEPCDGDVVAEDMMMMDDVEEPEEEGQQQQQEQQEERQWEERQWLERQQQQQQQEMQQAQQEQQEEQQELAPLGTEGHGHEVVKEVSDEGDAVPVATAGASECFSSLPPPAVDADHMDQALAVATDYQDAGAVQEAGEEAGAAAAVEAGMDVDAMVVADGAEGFEEAVVLEEQLPAAGQWKEEEQHEEVPEEGKCAGEEPEPFQAGGEGPVQQREEQGAAVVQEAPAAALDAIPSSPGTAAAAHAEHLGCGGAVAHAPLPGAGGWGAGGPDAAAWAAAPEPDAGGAEEELPAGGAYEMDVDMDEAAGGEEQELPVPAADVAEVEEGAVDGELAVGEVWGGAGPEPEPWAAVGLQGDEEQEEAGDVSMEALEAWMKGSQGPGPGVEPEPEAAAEPVAAEEGAWPSPALGVGGPLSSPAAALVFEPMDLMGMDEPGAGGGFGFTFDASATEVPPLEATPSPVARKKSLGHVPFAQDVRDSIPLFGDRQSISCHDSMTLDRLSLDDIAPFSRKKMQQHPAMDTLMEQPGEPGGSPGQEAHEPAAACAGHEEPEARVLPMKPLGVAAGGGGMHTPGPQAAPAGVSRIGAAARAAGSALRAGPGGSTPASAGGALSGRSRNGGTYVAATAFAAADVPATPGAAGSRLRAASPSVAAAGAKHGKATPAGAAGVAARAAAADVTGTPLNQQVGVRKVGSALKKPLTTPLPRATVSGGGAATPAPGPGAAPRALAVGAAAKPQATPPPHPKLASPPAALTPPHATAGAELNLVPASWATPLAQMAALPVEAALHAPLSDLSPFPDDWSSGFDNLRASSNIAEEARKLFSCLATNAGSASSEQVAVLTAQLSGALRTPQGAAARPLGSGPMPSPASVQMLEMQMSMMVQKLADAEGKQAALEKENEGLRDQLATMEFQSGMPSEGVDDMERQARQCAEEQLALVTQRLLVAEEAAVQGKREVEEGRERGERLQRQLEEERAARGSEVEALRAQLCEAAHERAASSSQVESLVAQLSAKCRECDAFQSALLSEQRRVDELQRAGKGKDVEIGQLQKANADTSAKLQKALESLTTVQVNQRKQAAESESKTAALSAAMARLQEDRSSISQELAAAAGRAKEAEGQVAQMKKDLAAAAAENKELLTICNQLLSQVEKAQ